MKKFIVLTFVALILIYSACVQNKENQYQISESSKSTSDIIDTNKPQNNRGLADITPTAINNREALVIGNASYDFKPLDKPAEDAKSMAKALNECKFRVIKSINASLEQMKQAIEQFIERLQPESVALFYYAGHGVRASRGGESFLIPVQSNILCDAQLTQKSIGVSALLSQLEKTNCHIKIIILDACRDLFPLRKCRSFQQGVGDIKIPRGTMIQYSTAIGEPALDGLYTPILVKYLKQKNLHISMLFNHVRAEVEKTTKGRQIPWEHSSLTGNFYFVPWEINDKEKTKSVEMKDDNPYVMEEKVSFHKEPCWVNSTPNSCNVYSDYTDLLLTCSVEFEGDIYNDNVLNEEKYRNSINNCFYNKLIELTRKDIQYEISNNVDQCYGLRWNLCKTKFIRMSAKKFDIARNDIDIKQIDIYIARSTARSGILYVLGLYKFEKYSKLKQNIIERIISKSIFCTVQKDYERLDFCKYVWTNKNNIPVYDCFDDSSELINTIPFATRYKAVKNNFQIMHKGKLWTLIASSSNMDDVNIDNVIGWVTHDNLCTINKLIIPVKPTKNLHQSFIFSGPDLKTKVNVLTKNTYYFVHDFYPKSSIKANALTTKSLLISIKPSFEKGSTKTKAPFLGWVDRSQVNFFNYEKDINPGLEILFVIEDKPELISKISSALEIIGKQVENDKTKELNQIIFRLIICRSEYMRRYLSESSQSSCHNQWTIYKRGNFSKFVNDIKTARYSCNYHLDYIHKENLSPREEHLKMTKPIFKTLIEGVATCKYKKGKFGLSKNIRILIYIGENACDDGLGFYKQEDVHKTLSNQNIYHIIRLLEENDRYSSCTNCEYGRHLSEFSTTKCFKKWSNLYGSILNILDLSQRIAVEVKKEIKNIFSRHFTEHSLKYDNFNSAVIIIRSNGINIFDEHDLQGSMRMNTY